MMKTTNRNLQVFLLFAGSFGILFVGMGLYPLLPLYASEFGATPALVGIYLAVINTTLSAGKMAAGSLANRVGARRLLVLAGLAGILALIGMGQATALWQVIALTGVVWFAGGVGLSLLSVFTGLVASNKSRGRSFSLLALAGPLGALLGGMVVGQMIARQGYGLMLVVLSVVWMLFPLVGLFGLSGVPQPEKKLVRVQSGQVGAKANPAFLLVILVSLLSTAAITVGRMGVSMSMQSLSFTAAQVSSTSTVSGLATIPFILVSGFLSDRLGRKYLMAFGYLLTAGSVLALGLSTQLWHFWTAASVILIARSMTESMASALAADILPKEALSRSLPTLYGLSGFAGVVSLAGAGYAIEFFGTHLLYGIIAIISASAAVMLLGLLGSQGRVRSPLQLPVKTTGRIGLIFHRPVTQSSEC